MECFRLNDRSLAKGTVKGCLKVAFLFSYGRAITATLDIAATLWFSLKEYQYIPQLAKDANFLK